MFSAMRRKLHLAAFNCNVATIASASELGLNKNSILVTVRLISSSLNTTKKITLTAENDEEQAKRHSFTVSYLVDSCGLSLNSAESAAKRVALKTQENPDEILGILREYGFSDAHISVFVRKNPNVLLARRKTIVPKLEFLRSKGVSGSDIGKMVAWNPHWLAGSLLNFVIPRYDVLKSILLDDDKVCLAISRISLFSLVDLPKTLVKNVSILKEFGVPQSRISFLLISRSHIVCHKTEKLARDLSKVIGYGFDPSKRIFVDALHVIGVLSPKTWEHKVVVYKSWGLSEDMIWLAFKKHPKFMFFSEKKITAMMDFLVIKMGWEPVEVARIPSVLSYSLDKWIVPRCSVIKTLMSEGFLKGKVPLSTVLVSSRKVFLKMFVMKYTEELPQLLDIFQGKTDVLTLGSSDKKSARKNF